MTTAGPFSATTAYDIGDDFLTWFDVGNAAGSDDSYATVLLGSGTRSSSIRAGGFGLAIPTGSTIDGVVVEIEGNGSGSTIAIQGVAMATDSGFAGTFDQFAFPTESTGDAFAGFDAYTFLGGVDDTWGGVLTPELLNDPAFSVDFYCFKNKAGSAVASVDDVRITVYYTEPSGTTYSLSAGGGNFALNGSPVGLKSARRLAAGSGSFALTGQALALKLGHRLAVGSGSFALTGQSVALKQGHRLGMGSGSFVLSGQAVALSRGRFIALAGGSFALTGSALALKYGRRLAVGSGSFALTGPALAFARSYRLALGSGSVVLAGSALSFSRGRSMVMASGSFALTGSPLAFKFTPPLAMGSGSFLLTGMRTGAAPIAPHQVKLFVPYEAPAWFAAVARSIERTLRERRLIEVDDAADLPLPAEYRSRLIHVTGLGVVAASTGAAWIRLDTGAAL